MRSAVVLILLLLSQDPADKVRALVEKLGSDEIAVRSQAHVALLKLGSSALPALREQESKSVGEVKVVLRSVISRIEIGTSIERLLGSATVTLDFRDAEITKVVAEMTRQTGLDITSFVLDSSRPVTLTCDRVPVWKAIDDLCLAYGGLGVEYSDTKVCVKDRCERCTPVALHRNIGIRFYPPRRQKDGTLKLQGALTYPPGLPIWSMDFEFEEITDDAGTSLVTRDTKTDVRRYLDSLIWEQGLPDQFCWWVSCESTAKVPEKASKLRRLRGAVVVKLAVEFKTRLKLDDPLKKTEPVLEGSGFKLSLLSTEREEDKVKLRLKILDQPAAEQASRELFLRGSMKAFGFRDDKGELHLAGSKTMYLYDKSILHMVALVPKGREVASFEFLGIQDFTEIRIPFDYADVPIGATKE